MTEAHLASRRQELEVVKRYYADPGKTKLSIAIQERFSEYMTKLPLIQRPIQQKGLYVSEADAKAEWMKDVREFVMKEMRQEWRKGQFTVLQNLAKELRAERKAAADTLNQHVQAWAKVHDAVKGAWEGELRQAEERLDHLAKAYRGALRSIFEAELEEARKHSQEQAEYFQREVAEAIKAEQAEIALNSAQLRRMRLALVKWQYDYLRDARRKAEEAAEHRRAAAAGWDEDEGDSLASSSVASPGPASKGGNFDDQLEGGEFWHDHGFQPGLSEGSVMAARAHSREKKAAAERLRDCRHILELIWDRLGVGEVARRDFLLRLEEKVPATGEVLLLYQQHLAEHGVMAALGTSPEARPAQGAPQHKENGWDGGGSTTSRDPGSPTMQGRESQPRVGGARHASKNKRRNSRALTGKTLGPGWR